VIGRRRLRRGFIERSLDALLHGMERVSAAEAAAGSPGWLQRIDPRVKLAGLGALIGAVALAHHLDVLAALLALGLLLALTTRLSLPAVFSGVWLAALGLATALALPALVLTPGQPVAVVPLVGWTVTAQGLRTAGYLVLRTAATATFGFVLIFTTRWPHVLKALRAFHVPVLFIVVLATTYRYILLLLDGAHDMFVARRARTVGRLRGGVRRRLLAQSAGVLLAKSLELSGEVFLAMRARGFRGDVYVVDEFAAAPRDWAALAAFALTAAAAIWLGR
jgi:cobalt/nickel transport system permease protein